MDPTEKEKFDKPGLNIRLDMKNADTIEVLDDIELTDHFKKSILSPYLRNLYDDLVGRTENPQMGISKTTFLEVM